MTSIATIAGGQIPAQFFATRRTQDGFTPATLRLDRGLIQSVDQETPLAGATLDASGCLVLPGFIDIHIHGAGGHDTMDASAIALEAMARFLARHGVTGFLPTTMSADEGAIAAALTAVAHAAETPPNGARILGAHMEGPFLNPQMPGAQRGDAIRPPNPDEFRCLLDAGPVRLVTLAPELPRAELLAQEARRRGIAVAMGHTAASFVQAQAAFAQGVSQVTHTFNAMPGLHHREPGAVGAALTNDAVYCQLIADGVHVHPAAMNILYRCKGPGKTILISDAIRAAGMGPGRYELGGLAVVVQDGACRLESGALAGSIATLDAGLRRLVAATGASPGELWPCTSATPARALGLDNRYGAIAPGMAADLTLLDEGLEVVATLVAGRLVYLRDSARCPSCPPEASE